MGTDIFYRASLTNTTIDALNGTMTFDPSLAWISEDGNFFNGTSIYTQGPDHAVSFNFTGSAVYIFGDQVDDHGLYSIYFNGSSTPYGTYNGRSGCGGGYKKECEKLGTLKFFAGGLPMGQHTLKLVNDGPSGTNETYFGMFVPPGVTR